jgi:hypothetical protein
VLAPEPSGRRQHSIPRTSDLRREEDEIATATTHHVVLGDGQTPGTAAALCPLAEAERARSRGLGARRGGDMCDVRSEGGYERPEEGSNGEPRR